MTRTELKGLTSPVAKDLAAFDRRLGKYLQVDSAMINAIIRHLMGSPGKRLRPVILFLSARAGGYSSPKLIESALAIELMHTATLLHDDVIDESEIRRGRDTVNHRWSNLISVLMGDFLFSRSFQLLVATHSPELIRAMSIATERVSYGELRQIEEVANYELSETEYVKIISDKTASLFSMACETGPILKIASNSERKRFRDFGEYLGIAFQIADDLLDYVGDKKKIGKQPGSDLLQGKVTLPLIHALASSSKPSRAEVTRIISNGFDQRGVERVLAFVTDQGGIEYAYGRALHYSERAGSLIEKLNVSPYTRAMQKILQFTVSRDN